MGRWQVNEWKPEEGRVRWSYSDNEKPLYSIIMENSTGLFEIYDCERRHFGEGFDDWGMQILDIRELEEFLRRHEVPLPKSYIPFRELHQKSYINAYNHPRYVASRKRWKEEFGIEENNN